MTYPCVAMYHIDFKPWTFSKTYIERIDIRIMHVHTYIPSICCQPTARWERRTCLLGLR